MWTIPIKARVLFKQMLEHLNDLLIVPKAETRRALKFMEHASGEGIEPGALRAGCRDQASESRIPASERCDAALGERLPWMGHGRSSEVKKAHKPPPLEGKCRNTRKTFAKSLLFFHCYLNSSAGGRITKG